jgi:hypothetical protein
MIVDAGPRLAALNSFAHQFRPDSSSSDDDVSFHAVLILSSDPLAAALLGAAVELAGHVPHFQRKDESARNALLRVRPRLVLVDCDHEEGCTDEFVGPALMTGARVLLFRSQRTHRNMNEFATRLSLRIVDMPSEHDALTALLREMLAE